MLTHRSMLGQRRSPWLVQCRQVFYDAGPTLLPTLGLLYTERQHPSNHVSFTQYCFNVGPTSSTLSDIETALGYCPLLAWTAMLVTLFLLPSPEKPLPDNTSVTLGQHYSNLVPLSPNHEYNRDIYFFLLSLFNTKLFDLATSNVIFDVFIMTVPQKCQPFSTHGTPLSANSDTNISAINLICSSPPAGPNIMKNRNIIGKCRRKYLF